MLFAVIIPEKLLPDDVIIPAFPLVLLNLKLPEIKFVSLVPSSNNISASNVDTPTALFNDLTSLNPKESTLVITLPSWTPFIKIDSSFKNLPVTSVKLKSVTLVAVVLTNPVAPLLAPCIWSDAVNEVIAVPTLISVNVFISNKRVSYWVVSFTWLADCDLKSYNLARPISLPLFPLLLESKETVAVVPIPKLGDPKILFTNSGSPVV